MLALASVSLVIYTVAIASVPFETWRRLPGRPAIHQIAIATGITALALTPSAAFVDGLIASVTDQVADAPNAFISYLDALRATLIVTVALITVDSLTDVTPSPAESHPDISAQSAVGGIWGQR